jgi:hypothetical protein
MLIATRNPGLRLLGTGNRERAPEIALRLGRIRRVAYPFRLMAARCDDTTAITIAAITLQIALVRIGVR